MVNITVDKLSHSFKIKKQRLQVLDNLTFEVSPGEVISILGPSGCGKSTLLRCLAGLLSPTSGTIKIGERPPDILIEEQLIGFGFQEPSLMDWRTVEQNICLPVELGLKKGTDSSVKSRVDELLEIIQMKEFRGHYPSQLSGGMKHRTALARALFLKPQVLFLDEPLASLDLLTRRALMEQIGVLLKRQQCTTVIVSHSVEEAVFWGDRIILLTHRPASILAIIEHKAPKTRSLSYAETAGFHSLVDKCSNMLLQTGAR